jgi:hypothetical protein
MVNDRFVNNTLSELQETNRNPISGYEKLLVLTLEDAVEKIVSLVPEVKNYVLTAKNECNHHSTLLTRDESAAIYLYSMPISFFGRLNETLRAENRQALKPWFAFLKLFINALEKLPSIKTTVWRGVSGNVGSIFADGRERIWWGVNSCSKDLRVVEQRLGDVGTVFAIDAIHGKDISAFSTFSEEQEIVLMPGTHVRPKCQSLSFDDRFFLIHLEEENLQRLVCIRNRHKAR